jgi:microcompartment protein CcmK/EutM
MLVHPIDLNGNFIGENDIIGLDLIDSGIGDVVLLAQEGGAVRQILQSKTTPAHSIIVAVVDKIEAGKF